MYQAVFVFIGCSAVHSFRQKNLYYYDELITPEKEEKHETFRQSCFLTIVYAVLLYRRSNDLYKR